MSYKQTIRSFIAGSLLLAAGIHQEAAGQSFSDVPALLEPSATQYFQNQYLANPAMAGFEQGIHLNAAYRHQWGGIEGAPVTKFFSADANFGARTGGGIHLFNDVAGLINRTRAAISYAYHLPLNEEQHLHFGLSLAFNFQHIDYKNLNGEINDPTIGAFNRRDNYFEAEYGMAYTDRHWNIQAALPNIRSIFTGSNKGVDGGGIFFTAASYKFELEDAISGIEPKVCYRGVRGSTNILDLGVNISALNNVANVMAMYHTSKSMTAGVGVNILRTVTVQAMYTTQTGGLKTYVDGTFEIGVRVNLLGK